MRKFRNGIRALFRAMVVAMPWTLKRAILVSIYKYEIDPSAKIGLSWVFPKRLKMGEGAVIHHFNMVKGMDLVEMGARSHIGRLNWITAYPTDETDYFKGFIRNCELIIEQHAAVTSRHFLDCTDRIFIGEFTTVGGFYSQLLTHSIEFGTPRQSCYPITIGKRCFVGTNCVLLPKAALPEYSILGSKSLLNGPLTGAYRLYGGTPAKEIKPLPNDLGYFTRKEGVVH